MAKAPKADTALAEKKQLPLPEQQSFIFADTLTQPEPLPGEGRTYNDLKEWNERNKDRLIIEKRMMAFYEKTVYQDNTLMPNVMGRSNLFRILAKNESKTFTTKWTALLVMAPSNLRIDFYGEYLTQFDLTVLLALIHKSREQNLFTNYSEKDGGIVVDTDTSELLFLTGKSKRQGKNSARDIEAMDKSILKLSTSKVKFTLDENDNENTYYVGPLLQLAPIVVENKKTKFGSTKYWFKINFLVKALLFPGDGDSFLNLKYRLALGDNQTAQAVQAYLSTQKHPHTLTKAKIFEYWGAGQDSEKTYLSQFISRFRRRCLDLLVKVGFLTHFEETKTSITFYWKKDKNKTLAAPAP